MKYSVDYHNDAISGWVGSASNQHFSVDILSSTGEYVETIANLRRPDVLNAGLTENVNCGFSFVGKLIKPLEGNFYQVKLESENITKTVSVFCGDNKKWQERFEAFQIADRNDFTIQEGNCIELFKKHSDLIAFKILMIRLRRGKRAFGWRGKFSGHEYPEMINDWQFFRNFYIENFKSLSKVLSIRSLWSVMDTFGDFGNEVESACALAVSNFMYQERFAQTFRRIFSFEKLEAIKFEGQTHYGGYMLSNQLKLDDSYDVFLTRNLEVLERCPIVKKTFCFIFLETLKNEMSINHINAAHSPYFSEAFSYYENLFGHVLDEI